MLIRFGLRLGLEHFRRCLFSTASYVKKNDLNSAPTKCRFRLVTWVFSFLLSLSPYTTGTGKFDLVLMYVYKRSRVIFLSTIIWRVHISDDYTRNTLTQASKNGCKPHLFPQKKFVSMFYAFNTIYFFKPTNFHCV